MNRERAKEVLPIIEHFANGGEVQWFDGADWMDTLNLKDIESLSYRLKPEPAVVYLRRRPDGRVGGVAWNTRAEAQAMVEQHGGEVVKLQEVIE